MMKSVFNMELDGLNGDFLVRLNRERRRSNVEDRKVLQKRVSNGDKLTTAEEATLSKLTAANESNSKHVRERGRSNVEDRKVLQKRVSNGDKLTTAEEATLSKLTAAYERKKKADRERAQRKRLKKND